MNNTKVVHCMKEPFDVYIGRGRCPRTGKLSKFGNPFSHQLNSIARFKVNSRREAIEKYREWIQTQPELMAALHELKGKTLGCWCAPQPCHGEVLIELVNAL
jgi:hypothetical protein